MATGKKKTKKKAKKTTSVNVADGISKAEARQILSAMPSQVKKKLRALW